MFQKLKFPFFFPLWGKKPTNRIPNPTQLPCCLLNAALQGEVASPQRRQMAQIQPVLLKNLH